MNEAQYERLLGNARPYAARRLFSGAEVSRLLRVGARQAARRERAAEAWRRVVPLEWADGTAVRCFENGVITVGVEHAAVRQALSQEARSYGARLAALVPGVRDVRFVAAVRGTDGGE